MGEALRAIVIQSMSGDIPEDSEEWNWASQSTLSLPMEACEGEKPEEPSEMTSNEGGQCPDPEPKEGSIPQKMDGKAGSPKGKVKGGQRGPTPEASQGQGDESRSVRRDLAKLEQKLDVLLERMDKFGQATAQPGEGKKERPEKPQPPPPPPAQPQPQPQPLPPPPPPAGKGPKKAKGGGGGPAGADGPVAGKSG